MPQADLHLTPKRVRWAAPPFVPLLCRLGKQFQGHCNKARQEVRAPSPHQVNWLRPSFVPLKLGVGQRLGWQAQSHREGVSCPRDCVCRGNSRA